LRPDPLEQSLLESGGSKVKGASGDLACRQRLRCRRSRHFVLYGLRINLQKLCPLSPGAHTAVLKREFPVAQEIV